jgi:hypothetical protein
VRQLGRNAHGEVLEPGRVPNCYLGLLLDPPRNQRAGSVLVVAPASLLHPCVPQPDGRLLYELLTGHPDRAPHKLVFLPDLTVELRAWPADTWSKVGIDPQAAARMVIAAWARRPCQGASARRANRRGGAGAGAAGHDLHAQPARRPPGPPGRPGVPAVAAPGQRTPARRPLPVAPDTRLPTAPDQLGLMSMSAAAEGARPAEPGSVRRPRQVSSGRLKNVALAVHCLAACRSALVGLFVRSRYAHP